MLKILKNYAFSSAGLNKTPLRCVINFNDVIKRNAGHSKWSNIRHQKAENDGERSKLFTKYSHQIRLAIVDGGSPNPELNYRLQSVIQQAKKHNMPQLTIQNAIQNATAPNANKKCIIEGRGPSRIVVIVEVLTHHVPVSKQHVSNILRKHSFKPEVGLINMFTERGIIVADPLKNDKEGVEMGTDHAIEFGAEDVQYIEDNNQLEFECSPSTMLKVKNELEKLGYNIHRATLEYIPNFYIDANEDEIEVLTKMYEKLEALPECVRITDNVS